MLTVSLCCRRPRARLTLLVASNAVAYYFHPPPRSRDVENNAVTALPPGLFDSTTVITNLYGCPRITTAVDAHSAQAHRSTAILCNRIAGLFVCFDRLLSTLCSDVSCVSVLPLYSHGPCVRLTPGAVAWVCHPSPRCRGLENNFITAIPLGLFDFATTLTELYGRFPINLIRPANMASLDQQLA